ncbi:MAG TPA: hypothetical protein VK843_12980 [Planctomycetota bacterium]|nr:hypothetical protein [Planctomycetota bacterium]
MKSNIAILSILVWVTASCSKGTHEGGTVRAEGPPPVALPSNEANRLPAEVETLLREASTMELISIDPNELPPDAAAPAQETFHGYKVLGRAPLADAGQRKTLAELVLQGIRESDGRQEKCFEPRHGIRVEQDARVLELVICYECLSIKAFGNVFGAGHGAETVLTSRAVEPAVTSAFNKVGLTIAAK